MPIGLFLRAYWLIIPAKLRNDVLTWWSNLYSEWSSRS